MIRVLIADDHGLVRAGLEQLLGNADDIEVVGGAAGGHEAVAARRAHAARRRPDGPLDARPRRHRGDPRDHAPRARRRTWSC